MTDLRAHWLSVVDSGHALLDFMTAGGVVMWALAGLCVLYWTLVFERLWFMRRVFPHWVESRRQAWAQLADEPGSWQRAVRLAWLAQAQQQLSGPLRLSKTLVAMYPLLGLLGTVSGMIAVFDVLALSGTGNPRGMAAGGGRKGLNVSRAKHCGQRSGDPALSKPCPNGAAMERATAFPLPLKKNWLLFLRGPKWSATVMAGRNFQGASGCRFHPAG